jgi:hypothetical protein
VLDRHGGLDARLGELAVALQQIVERVEGERGVVHPDGARLLRPGHLGRDLEQGDPVVLVVEGHEGQPVTRMHDVGLQDRAVPVAHRFGLRGLEDDVDELRRGSHGCLLSGPATST